MNKLVLVGSNRIGRGDKELGKLLMRNFLYAVARSEQRPSMVFLVNGGVNLACEGSDSLDDLRILAEAGVPVLSCGTCLDFLELKDSLRVGEVGRMDQLVDSALTSTDVVTVG